MKMLKKTTAVTIALFMVCCMIGSAFAEKIYTSPSFKIPTGLISDETEGADTGMTDETRGEQSDADQNSPDQPDEVQVNGADSEPDNGLTDEDGTVTGTETEQIPDDETVGEQDPELAAGDEAVSKGQIQIRIAPDGMSEIIGEALDGSRLEILSVNGDWAFVLYGSVTGYVHVSQLSGIINVVDDEVNKEMKVTIFTSRKTVVTEGEPIYLTSILEGFENCTVTFQWQYDRGNGWEDIAGATRESYVFNASAETLAYSWRLRVHYETQE